MLPVEQPFKTYTGKDGLPLTDGYVYFGLPSENPVTSPVAVFWDADGTIPALQPLRTSNGYITRAGTPANVFFDGSYSEMVLDAKGRQVFYAKNSEEFSIATIVRGFISSLTVPSGSSVLGFIQSSFGAVVRSVLDKLRERKSVYDFGAKGDGATDDTLAIKAAIAANVALLWPTGTYKLTDQINVTAGCHWEADGLVTLSFVGVVSSKDCLRFSGGAGYLPSIVNNNFVVDCNASGRDGVVLMNGDHCKIKIRVKNAQRDGFAVFCGGFDWVENADLDIYTEANGRHGMRIEVWDNKTSFFNESALKLEVRGVSRRYNDGNGLVGYCPASSGGSKIASLHITNINLDAMRGEAVANGFEIGQNPIRLVYAPGGTNSFQAWKIDGGGLETTTGSADNRSPYLIYADPGVSAPYWDVRGLVPFNWSQGNGLFGLNDYVFHSCKDNGGMSTSRVIGGISVFKGYAASSTFDIDVPIPELPANGNYGSTFASVIYDLCLSYQQFNGGGTQEMHIRRLEISLNKSGAGIYWLSSIVVASNIGAGIATVNSLAIVGGVLRVNLTTAATFGTGGGDNHIHTSLMRVSVARD